MAKGKRLNPYTLLRGLAEENKHLKQVEPVIREGISGGLIFNITKKSRQVKNTPENREKLGEIKWLDKELDEVGHKLSALEKSKNQKELERCKEQCKQLRGEKKKIEDMLDRE